MSGRRGSRRRQAALATLLVGWLLLGAGPSPLVLPRAPRGVRFDHARHAAEGHDDCRACHARASRSRRARDLLRPAMLACRACHDVPDPPPSTPPAGPACGRCHLQLGVMPPGPLAAPRPQVRFNHALHQSPAADCAVCHPAAGASHGLPRMSRCLECHDGLTATSQCARCHAAGADDRLRTRLPGGALAPTGQVADDDHRHGWTARHGRGLALADREHCAACHQERDCLECHAGVGKPQSIHGGNWATLHPVAARSRSLECTSCHRTQSFCLPCHSRLGVAPGSPWTSDNLRLHPRDWAAPGAAGHASTARRNPNACLGCHNQGDCIACHGAAAAGFGGRNPHRHLSRGELERRYGRNRRPCQACHAGQYPEGFR